MTGTAALRAFLVAAGVGVGLWGSAGQAGAASVRASIKKDVLTVIGTPDADTIALRLRPGDTNTLEVDVGGDGTAEFSFDRARFTKISVQGGPGNDTLLASHLYGTLTAAEATTLDGGDGNDSITGEAGGDTLLGGAGDDLVDGNQGADTIVLGDGADVVQWDPGDTGDVVNGGAGADRLAFNGSNASERLELAPAPAGHARLTRDVGNVVMDLDDLEVVDLRTFGGTDTVIINAMAGKGADTLTGGDGNDVFQWDPGDTSDVVTGGAGADRLRFNGSGASERLELSAAAAGHVRLTRDVASVVMDLDDVETVDLRAFAGIDTITVNDLTGTDVTAVGTDLAAFGGGDDSSVDTVVVNGTAGDDTITVVDSGSDVVVQGLPATVRVAGGMPASDRLTVHCLAGNDSVTATPAAGTLIGLDLVP